MLGKGPKSGVHLCNLSCELSTHTPVSGVGEPQLTLKQQALLRHKLDSQQPCRQRAHAH